MTSTYRRTFAPEHSTSQLPWLPMPDDGDQGGGGASDEPETDAPDEESGESDADEDVELGDKGQKALDRMKEERRTLRAELRQYKALGLTPEQIKALQDAGKKDEAPDADSIREEARREARAEALKERVSDKIEARARKFADPEDAVAILLRTHTAEDFLDGDKIDIEAIQEALDDLLDKKPHLAAAQSGPRFKGTADGGTRKEARPAQLTRDDLKRLSPQEIVKAKADGRLADLLGSK